MTTRVHPDEDPMDLAGLHGLPVVEGHTWEDIPCLMTGMFQQTCKTCGVSRVLFMDMDGREVTYYDAEGDEMDFEPEECEPCA